MERVSAELAAAIAALWQGPPRDIGGTPRSLLFDKLVEICVQAFPEAAGTSGKSEAPDTQGVRLALANALRATGTPWAVEDSWLVVHERRSLAQPVGSRAVPFLYQTLDQPFGAIEPYTRTWPEVVEIAVFTLLTLPWESMMEYHTFEWRGFRVPWSYTVITDPLARPALPPRSDSLSWEPDIFDDPSTGETIELERPVVLQFSIEAGQ
jgi:hypothetical protein